MDAVFEGTSINCARWVTCDDKKMMNDLKAFEGVDVPSMKDFWSWVGKSFKPPYQDEVEMYLKDSVDHNDLQTRVSTLMRRGMI